MKEACEIIKFSYSPLAISARRVHAAFCLQEHLGGRDPALSLMSAVDMCGSEVIFQDEYLKDIFNHHFQYYLTRLNVYVRNISDPYNAYLLLAFSVSSLIFSQAQRNIIQLKQNTADALKIPFGALLDDLNATFEPGFSPDEYVKYKQLLNCITEINSSKDLKDIIELLYVMPHFMYNEILYMQALSKSGLASLI